jgi:hypothetical protein
MAIRTFLRFCARRCVVALLSTLLVVSASAKAQTSLFEPRATMTEAPPILSASTTSDALAVRALGRVVASSGGAAAWRTIRSAKIRLTVSAPGATKSHDLLSLDDWSSENTIYRRGIVGGRRTPHDHTGRSTFVASDEGKSRTVPEFDQARVLAGSLPAAAAEIILRNHLYLAKMGSGTRCSEETICIDIYRQPTEKAPFVREEEWFVSQSTGLPTVIDVTLPNLMGIRPIVEEFRFSQMLTVDGVAIPAKVEMRHPSGSTQIRNVVSFLPNAKFDAAAFDKEVGQ